jgi:DNA-binding NarL/FixJ family response regulator
MEVVSTTSGGKEALEALASCRADILLLDLLLPDVPEPADLVSSIRELSPGTAILLMSNLPPAQLAKEAERLGTEGWTPKANKPEQLRNSVREIIAARA